MITITIHEGPISPATHEYTDAGAVICFEGVVRPTEDGRPIEALDYEVYEPMAQATLSQIAEQTRSRFGVLAIDVAHSRGRVPVGQCSFRLVIAGKHRKESLAAMDHYIDRLKQDAPIWKTPVYLTQNAETKP